MPASVRVAPAAANSPRISPMQYGQFIEYLCDMVPGMWADKLDDGSFEGLTPYAFVFLKETDWRARPWHPTGAVNRAEVVSDDTSPVQGKLSLRISTLGATPCTVGVAQRGIAVRRGLACRFSGHMKAERPTRVRVAIEDRGHSLGQQVFDVGGGWTRYEALLTPGRTCTDAKLTITYRGPGTVWLDCVSLMPEDAVGGWRRDVVEALRALRPGVVRFGGSVVDYPAYGDYDWRKTIGPVESRVPFRSWGGLQPPGAGLEEIVQLIQAVGAEPLICVRFMDSSPEEAAAQVQYFNGPVTTAMGALRRRNGRTEPYRIRYWQVGNEVGGEDYGARLAAFCRAMKDADPTIHLLSSYPSERVIRAGAELLDYVSPHHYGCADLEAMRSNIAEVRANLARLAPGRDIRIAVTEWNTTAGDWGPTRAGLWTLANALACSRYHNLLHRHADIVEIANRSNLANSFCSGIIQTDTHRLYRTPTYFAQQLYATRAGNLPLPVVLPPGIGLDVSATADAKSRRVSFFVVNDGLEAIPATIDAAGLGIAGGAVRVTTLTDRDGAGEPDVTNTFDRPDRVTPATARARAVGSRIAHTFPSLSLTLLEWKAERSVQAASHEGPDL